jgi:hypothetical protein
LIQALQLPPYLVITIVRLLAKIGAQLPVVNTSIPGMISINQQLASNILVARKI